MEDYPRDLTELEARFSTEAACREYLFQLRWPDGFRCPRCGETKSWPQANGLVRCAGCDYQSSVTAGTIFQDSRLPLTLWFRAVWWVTSQKNGVSAMGLQRVLGLKSCKTAWALLHKLRRAMVRPGRDRLKGTVEVDEAFVGGVSAGTGRDGIGKALVAIAAEEDGKGIGRIRLARVPDGSTPSLHGFIQQSVAPGSTVHTDGWAPYQGLEKLGYSHTVTTLKGQGKEAAVELLPRVHRVASLLKRWLLGTHQGAVGPTHLDYYLDEFTFRFNRRRSASRGKLFFRLLQQAVQVGPATYESIVGKSDEAPKI